MSIVRLWVTGLTVGLLAAACSAAPGVCGGALRPINAVVPVAAGRAAAGIQTGVGP